MFDTPYQTTPCSRFVLDKITTGIRQQEISEALIEVQGAPGIALVRPGVVDFPPFQQAITKVEAPTLQHSVVIDGRKLLRGDGSPVRIDTYAHAILTARLIQRWVEGDVGVRRDFLSVGDFPVKCFASWISGTLSLRLSLDFAQTAMLRALATIYFIQLHESADGSSTALDQDRLMVRAARSLPGVDPVTLGMSVGEVPKMKNIAEFVVWVKKTLSTARTDELTVGFLYIALAASYGVEYREAVTVALEYPPIFIAMVYTATQDRGYMKTGLGRVVERCISRDNAKEFAKNVNLLLKG